MAETKITISATDLASDVFQRVAAALRETGNSAGEASPRVDAFGESVQRGTHALQEHADLLPGFIAKYIEARTIVGLATTAYEDYIELIKGSIEAYGMAEEAEVRLSAALSHTGAEGATEQYIRYADELSRTTTISKTAGIEAAGTFALIGQVAPDSMQRALQAAADFSAGTGRSFDAAALAIAKASDGNVSQLKRFGVEIDTERAKTEGIGYVLDAVSAKFDGQAQALAGTLLGSWKQMGNQWELAEEQLGAKLAPSVIAVEHALSSVIGVIAESPGAFLALVGASTALAGSMVWMAAAAAYGAQLSALAGIIGGELTANVALFNGVALTAEGSVLGLAAAETTVSATSVLASGSILGLSEAAGVADVAIAGTTAEIGLLNVALLGPVAIVFSLAYLLGKLADSHLHTNDAIYAWRDAEGQAALATETAGAKLDVVNRAIELGAPKTISYGDAVKYVNDQFAHTKDTLPDATQLLAGWQKQIDDNYAKLQRQKVLIDAIRNQPGFVEGSSFHFAEDEQAAKKAEEATLAYRKAVQQLVDTLEGHNAKEGETVEALQRVAHDGLVLGTDAADRFAAAVTKLVAEGVAVPPLLTVLARAVDDHAAATKTDAAMTALQSQEYANLMLHLQSLIPVYQDWAAMLPQTAGDVQVLASHSLPEASGALVDFAAGNLTAEQALKALLVQLRNAPDDIGIFDTVMGDMPKVLERAFAGGGGASGAVKAIGADVGKNFGQSMQEKLWTQMGTSEDSGSALTKMFGDKIGGALTTALPGIGAVIGPLAGKLFGMIANIGGPSAAELDGRKLEASFEQSFGGFDKMMAAVGQGYATAGLSAKQAQSDVAALMAAEKQGTTATQAALDTINANIKTGAAAVSGGVQGILDAAKIVGLNFPSAMQPVIAQLSALPGLTDAEKNSLLGLAHAGEPSFNDLSQAAGRYGLTLDTIGGKAGQLSISTEADQIESDYKTLVTTSGADSDKVLAGMKDSLTKLVNHAMDAGDVLPTALKPLVDQLFNTGQLTDDAGNKITDLSKLKFDDTGDPLATGMKSLTDAINHLGDLLSPSGLPKTAADAANAIGGALGGIKAPEIAVHYRYVADNAMDGSATSFANEGFDLTTPTRAIVGDNPLQSESVLHASTVKDIVRAARTAGAAASAPSADSQFAALHGTMQQIASLLKTQGLMLPRQIKAALA